MTTHWRNTNLIILIVLTSLLSVSRCTRQNNISGLKCTIKTSVEGKIKGVRNNVTTKTTVINRCAAGYPKADMIRKCEHLIDSEKPFHEHLFAPITNSRNVTFWNRFCALCNRDVEMNWGEWRSWVQYHKFDDPCADYESKIRVSDVDSLHEFTQTFIAKDMKLMSMFKDRKELECRMEGRWPIHLLHRVIPCLVNDFRDGQIERLDSCQYAEKNGRICMKMRFFIEGIKFEFGNSTGAIYEKWTELQFTRGEYVVESGYDNVFYICEQPEVIYAAGHWAKISITAVSIIFISGYLVAKFDTKYFQNFTNKVIYSYSAGLIIMYLSLTFIYLSFPVSCVVFYLAKFSWFYHLFWTKIITAEFFHLIYYAYRKRSLDTKSQHIRYLICCIFGFVLPTVLLSIYYLILQNNDNHCPSIPGHFSMQCNPLKDSRSESFMNVLNLILKKNFSFFMPILFVLAHICAVIYFTECGPSGMRSKNNKYHLISLMQMSYFMAFHWILHKICVTYGRDKSITVFGLNTNMDTISQLSVDLQGVLVFFVFVFEKDMLIGVLNKCGCRCKTRSQQSSYDAAKITVNYRPSTDGEQGNSAVEVK